MKRIYNVGDEVLLNTKKATRVRVISQAHQENDTYQVKDKETGYILGIYGSRSLIPNKEPTEDEPFFDEQTQRWY